MAVVFIQMISEWVSIFIIWLLEKTADLFFKFKLFLKKEEED